MATPNMKEEYSDRFDEIRRGLVEQSFYKYGPARQNFGRKNVSALGSLDKCIEKYKETGNTEYLADAANYCMFEFMFPSIEGARFQRTGSSESAGIVGMSVNEMKEFGDRR